MTDKPQEHALSGTAHMHFNALRFLARLLSADEIRGDSPAGVRPCAGPVILVTQPATAPSGLNSGSDGAPERAAP